MNDGCGMANAPTAFIRRRCSGVHIPQCSIRGRASGRGFAASAVSYAVRIIEIARSPMACAAIWNPAAFARVKRSFKPSWS